jgi:hypothetical protein
MIYLRVTSDELVVFLELSTLRRPIICIRSFNNALVQIRLNKTAEKQISRGLCLFLDLSSQVVIPDALAWIQSSETAEKYVSGRKRIPIRQNHSIYSSNGCHCSSSTHCQVSPGP